MESAICLRYCPFPYGSKELQAARPSRFHLKFNHATPFYVPQFSTIIPSVTHSIKNANCMLERFSVPSENENERKSGNKILRGVTAVSLVLACVLGLFHFRGMMNPKFNTAYAWSFKGDEAGGKSTQPLLDKPYDVSKVDVDPSKVEGDGRFALKSLLEIMIKPPPTDSKPPPTDSKPPPTDSKRPPIDEPAEDYVNKLKLCVIHKINGGNDALKKLENYYLHREEYQQAKEYIEVAWVEVLIFQGKYKEAQERLDDQIDELIEENYKEARKRLDHQIAKKLEEEKNSKWYKLLVCYYDPEMWGPTKLGIPKRILYKAIVHTLLEDSKEAAKWWQTFMRTLPSS